MTARGLRRYIDDLLRGRRPEPFRPDDFEAAQIRTAIDLQAARPGSDRPREEFLSDLHQPARRADARHPARCIRGQGARRPAAGDRRDLGRRRSGGSGGGGRSPAVGRREDHRRGRRTASGGEMVPNDGSWQAVAASSDVGADGVMHPFEHGSLIGFVRRVEGRPRRCRGCARIRVAGYRRQTRRPAALPVPFDIVFTHRAGPGPSAAPSHRDRCRSYKFANSTAPSKSSAQPN